MEIFTVFFLFVHLMSFTDYVLGEGNNSFLNMDTWCRREVLSLLFFLPAGNAKLYECLFKLTRRLEIEDAELDFMLQVLHHRLVMLYCSNCSLLQTVFVQNDHLIRDI